MVLLYYAFKDFIAFFCMDFNDSHHYIVDNFELTIKKLVLSLESSANTSRCIKGNEITGIINKWVQSTHRL